MTLNQNPAQGLPSCTSRDLIDDFNPSSVSDSLVNQSMRFQRAVVPQMLVSTCAFSHPSFQCLTNLFCSSRTPSCAEYDPRTRYALVRGPKATYARNGCVSNVPLRMGKEQIFQLTGRDLRASDLERVLC